MLKYNCSAGTVTEQLSYPLTRSYVPLKTKPKIGSFHVGPILALIFKVEVIIWGEKNSVCHSSESQGSLYIRRFELPIVITFLKVETLIFLN